MSAYAISELSIILFLSSKTSQRTATGTTRSVLAAALLAVTKTFAPSRHSKYSGGIGQRRQRIQFDRKDLVPSRRPCAIGNRFPADYSVDFTHLASHCQEVFLLLLFLGPRVLPSLQLGYSKGDQARTLGRSTKVLMSKPPGDPVAASSPAHSCWPSMTLRWFSSWPAPMTNSAVPLTSSPRALWPERRYGKYGRGIGYAQGELPHIRGVGSPPPGH